MKTIRSLLAVSVLTMAGIANAAPIAITATLDSQTGRTLSGNTSLTGSVEFDSGGNLVGLSLTSDGLYSAHTTAYTMTYYSGSTWSAVTGSGISLASLASDGSGGYIATYLWGIASQDSNGAGAFSGITPTCSGGPICLALTPVDPGWDTATLTVYMDGLLTFVSATLETTEIGFFEDVVSTYSMYEYSPLRTYAPEVPLPAAAWLFVSGLIGLAGAASRRRGDYP